MALTAFRTRKGLVQWLENYGLALGGSLDNGGDWCKIIGSFSRKYTSPQAVASMIGKRIRLVDNGEYTDGVIVADHDGHHTVYLAGPNEKRVVHDYRESQSMEYGDWVDDEATATA
jgi:hypothetical protein